MHINTYKEMLFKCYVMDIKELGSSRIIKTDAKDKHYLVKIFEG